VHASPQFSIDPSELGNINVGLVFMDEKEGGNPDHAVHDIGSAVTLIESGTRSPGHVRSELVEDNEKTRRRKIFSILEGFMKIEVVGCGAEDWGRFEMGSIDGKWIY